MIFPFRPIFLHPHAVRLLTLAATLGVVVNFAPPSNAAEPAQQNRDLVIYGATSAGVAAAVQAARMKLSVVLIEPTDHVGGLTTNGLGYTDTGDKRAIGGVAREFYQAVKRHYDQPANWRQQRQNEYSRYRPADDAMWTFEPHVAEAIFERWLREHEIEVVREQRLDRRQGVKLTNNRIIEIRMENGSSYAGKMFIDATYEGDLLAAAGVSYTVGRESNAKYGEHLNGVQRNQNTHNHRFRKNVDPYRTPGNPDSGLVAGVSPGKLAREGQRDRGLQAFCYRMCMTRSVANQAPFPKPAGYDASEYELLFRNFEAGDLRWPLHPGALPNDKTDTNNNGAFSTDYIGANHNYAEASYDAREALLRKHKRYQQGLMWTLANHPRVPAEIRKESQRWGLARDEFVDNDHWPRQIYVREARRMVSDYVLTELDCRRVRNVEDPVGLGSYNMDSHNVHRYVTEEGFVQNEGDVQVSPGGAYLISYRSIRPRVGEAENLLIPVCLSASHIAFGSVRMEPVFMVLGQSAATAAAIAIKNQSAVQDVQYAELKTQLLHDRQVVSLPAPTPAKVYLGKKGFAGIVLDDSEAKFAGAWTGSTSNLPYLLDGYRHDSNTDKGEKKATFRVTVEPGEYEIRLGYTSHSNRATRVPVHVRSQAGKRVLHVNQRQPRANKQLFKTIARIPLQGDVEIIITNDATDGYVIVDAIQLVPIK